MGGFEQRPSDVATTPLKMSEHGLVGSWEDGPISNQFALADWSNGIPNKVELHVGHLQRLWKADSLSDDRANPTRGLAKGRSQLS